MLFLLFLYPVIGVLWFLNLVTLLKKIKEDRNYHNQKVLGSVYSFILLLPIIMILAAVLY